MKILILGGTNFIGPHLIDAATQRGHELTLFNRGKTAPERFTDIVQRRGDRKEGDYAALADGEWDAVIDTCAYWPRAIRQSLAALEGKVSHYVFISSVSVYETFDPDGYDEDAPLATTDDLEAEDVTPKNYGALKALCEAEFDAFAGRTTIIRPGLVAGPGDPTDRFTYWPVKLSRGGEVLAPGSPEDPIQYIDVRDLAAFVVRTLEEALTGVFNLVTPAGAHTMGELVEACAPNADVTWVDATFLHAHDVRPWNHLPIWVPPGSPLAGIPHCSAIRAVEAGLALTPLKTTVEDVLEWFREERDDALHAGMSDEREKELLEAWHGRDAQ